MNNDSISSTPQVLLPSVKSNWWVVQLHRESLEVGGTAAPAVTKPEKFLMDTQNIPSKKTKPDPPAAAWLPPAMHYHISVLHAPAHTQKMQVLQHRKHVRCWRQVSCCPALCTLLAGYQTTLTSSQWKGSFSSSRPRTGSHCLSQKLPSPFTDPLSSSHLALLIVLSPISIKRKPQHHRCSLRTAWTLSANGPNSRQILYSTLPTPGTDFFSRLLYLYTSQKIKGLGQKGYHFNWARTHTILPHEVRPKVSADSLFKNHKVPKHMAGNVFPAFALCWRHLL